MSTQYNGNPLNTLLNLPVSVNITSSTNASPIVVTTTTPHGLTTNDFVSINDHFVNTNANGTWPCVVLSPTTLRLVGSSGNGVGGATGTVYSLAAGPTYAIPSDGDAITAASVNVALEALGDRTAFHETLMGGLKLVSISGVTLNVDTYTQWDHFTVGTLVDGSWNAPAGSTFWTPFTDVQISDVVEIELDLSLNISMTGSKNVNTGLIVGMIPPGAGAAPSPFTLPGSQRILVCGQFTQNEIHPVRYSGKFASAIAGTVGIEFAANPVDHTTLVVLSMLGAYELRVKIWRPTGVLQ